MSDHTTIQVVLEPEDDPELQAMNALRQVMERTVVFHSLGADASDRIARWFLARYGKEATP